jgi:uncharacterized DUF497 family protein
MQFEWDQAKAESNLELHGVTFAFATAAFSDPSRLEDLDDLENYGEDRTILIGHAHGVLLTVVYTERGAANRIISARRATRNEQDRFYCENSPGREVG